MTDVSDRTSDTAVDEAVARAGFDALHDLQRVSVDALRRGQDVLAILPTGGGKSAIYQIAGTLIDGPTIVVSPLLALQQDQLAAIGSSDLPAAATIDGSTSSGDRAAILARLADGSLEFLFTTPETLTGSDLLEVLTSTAVSLLVIDEAHCIATWGHSYRPAYLELGRIRQELGSPRCLALTASADPRLRDDIQRELRMSDPLVVSGDVMRTNIELGVQRLADADEAEAKLIEDLSVQTLKTIVYVPRIAAAERLADSLASSGREASVFHGRLTSGEKERTLEWFRTSGDGVVFATTAFGMGIDIEDISQVCHLDLPPSLIDYYQEIGRAGRNGEAASAVAYVGTRRVSRRSFAGGVRSISTSDCAAVLTSIIAGARSRRAVADTSELPAGRVSRALTVLEMAGVVRLRPRWTVLDPSVASTSIEDLCNHREEFDRSQRAAVERYPVADTCRWQQILAALGEASATCGNCDRCREHPSDGAEAEPLLERRLEHVQFGSGTISSVDDGSVTVTFDEVGPKVLDLDLCLREEIVTFERSG